MSDQSKDQPNQSTFRWLLEKFIKTEQFKNTITLIVVLAYLYMKLNVVATGSEFDLLVGMILGNYFKKGSEES